MKICIFCSANNQLAPVFFQQTAALGQWAARQGHTIVFGGVNQGLMECVAKAAKEAGGQTVGVVPSIVEATGRTSKYNDVIVTCDNLSERKQLMLEESDVFIALPGGLGTLDEVMAVVASATIGYHHKRVILYNINDFWHQLVLLLDDMQAKGMVRGNWHDYIAVANTLEEIEVMLSA
jgi:uncharacterized protein (TIGR00730 family)